MNLSKYITGVYSTISVNKKLKKQNIEVKLIDCTNYSSPIKTDGIEVGTPTKVGTHLVTFNELYK